ncbi:MAG: hypothetical protein ACKEQK_00635, partial [Candidatus Hodgkinia cicadicola]
MSLRFQRVLILPEFTNGVLGADAQALLAFALANASVVDVLAINCTLLAALSIGVSQVHVLVSKAATNVRAALPGIASLLSALSISYDAIFVAKSSIYHAALCRASARLNKVVITNVFEIAPDGSFVRSTAEGCYDQRVICLSGPPYLLSINTSITKGKALPSPNETKTIRLIESASISSAKLSVERCIIRKGRKAFGCPSLT